jgi:hypothetical protein
MICYCKYSKNFADLVLLNAFCIVSLLTVVYKSQISIVFKEWKTLRVLKVVGGSEVKSHLTLYYFKTCSLEIWWKILLKLLAVNIISFTSTQSKWTDLIRRYLYFYLSRHLLLRDC